jgi:hypothetical protein
VVTDVAAKPAASSQEGIIGPNRPPAQAKSDYERAVDVIHTHAFYGRNLQQDLRLRRLNETLLCIEESLAYWSREEMWGYDAG